MASVGQRFVLLSAVLGIARGTTVMVLGVEPESGELKVRASNGIINWVREAQLVPVDRRRPQPF